jgi:hypothetical protein
VLFDHKYTVRRVTRSVQKALEESDERVKAARNEDDSDKVVEAIAQGMDALLAGDGHETPASDVLTAAWSEDRLSLTDLMQLDNDLQEAAVARPT